jgi:hypothetical protein
VPVVPLPPPGGLALGRVRVPPDRGARERRPHRGHLRARRADALPVPRRVVPLPAALRPARRMHDREAGVRAPTREVLRYLASRNREAVARGVQMALEAAFAAVTPQKPDAGAERAE